MNTHAAELLARIETLENALYAALPFVEDHEESPIYKPQAVAQTVARIRAALGEPAPAKLRQAAPLMLDALQRITHPAADDSDLENALQVIAQATGEPTP